LGPLQEVGTPNIGKNEGIGNSSDSETTIHGVFKISNEEALGDKSEGDQERGEEGEVEEKREG
jgi:hypothetical protein